MRQIATQCSSTERTQRIYARLAGFLFLWLIITGLAGALIISHIVGTGTFAETAKKVGASERLYRIALSSELIETLSAALLAFALYITLQPVNVFVAQLAMFCRMAESFLGCVVIIFGYTRLRLYTSPLSIGPSGTEQSQDLVDFARYAADAAANIGVICFGIGSLLFFYLFFKSRYIPRVLSAVGVVASIVWTILFFGNLIFPQRGGTLQYACWGLMAIAEVGTGVWLMLFAIKSQADSDRSGRPAVSSSQASSFF